MCILIVASRTHATAARERIDATVAVAAATDAAISHPPRAAEFSADTHTQHGDNKQLKNRNEYD